jgi:anti-sigma factor RsiW
MTATDTMLMAYVDGELDAAGVSEVEQLIAADPQTRAAVEMHRQTAALLRGACGEAAYASGAAQLLPTAARRIWPRRRLAWAAAACLVVGVAVGSGTAWIAMQQSEMASLVDEIAEYHEVFSHETAHLVEVPASRTQELAAWLGERLQRRLDIPDLTAEGLRFAGGRMLVVDGAPVAQLMYTRATGLPVAVCIGRMEGASRPVALQRRGMLHVASWLEDGYAYVVIGQMPEGSVRNIAEHVRAQSRA